MRCPMRCPSRRDRYVSANEAQSQLFASSTIGTPVSPGRVIVCTKDGDVVTDLLLTTQF